MTHVTSMTCINQVTGIKVVVNLSLLSVELSTKLVIELFDVSSVSPSSEQSIVELSRFRTFWLRLHYAELH